MASDYLWVAMFTLVGIGFAVVSLLMSWVVRPYKPDGQKRATYECGEQPKGNAWVQLRPGYYIYMLVFVVFDVEVLFIFPWALTVKSMKGWLPIVDMVIFVGVLALGLVYAWKKGVLKWE